jgi:hypothetical protein
VILLRGVKRDYAPISPIELLSRFSDMLVKLNSVERGDRRHDAPTSDNE